MNVPSSPRDTIPLSHGGPIPCLGLGVFRIPDGEEVQRAVGSALEAGYRHIDTASVYRNERGVGEALRASDLSREEVFVTTKLWNDDHGYDRALRAFDESLDRLGLEWVDLYLIHWPVAEARRESWRALERLHDEGRARAIGVSNFMTTHLEDLLASCHVAPAVNQIELHPFNYATRRAVVEFCRERGIAVEAYSPLTKGRRLDDPGLRDVARRIGRTPAQVLIRYALQKDTIVLPKSANRERIRENAHVFDFRLEEQEMALLDALDEGYNAAWDPTGIP